MPFFEIYAFHLDDALIDKYCRPADFFACDTLMQKELEEARAPHANELHERPNAALHPSSRTAFAVEK